MTTKEAESLVSNLFTGSTCYHHVYIELIIGNYVLVHHKSHREWVNRMTGAVNCEAWHCLVTRDLLAEHLPLYGPAMNDCFPISYQGKTTKERVQQVIDYALSH